MVAWTNLAWPSVGVREGVSAFCGWTARMYRLIACTTFSTSPCPDGLDVPNLSSSGPSLAWRSTREPSRHSRWAPWLGHEPFFTNDGQAASLKRLA